MKTLPALSRRRKLPPLSEVRCRQTHAEDAGLSIRFDEHVATNFA
jgi:hypothetical protein